MDEQLDALRASSDRLHSLVTPLSDDQLSAPAYPTEWTVADVLSHLGSAAVIMELRVDRALDGEPFPDDAAPGVWDEWNAKAPRAQADDSLAVDRAFLARMDGLSAHDCARPLAMGPLQLEVADLAALRLNEHVLHTWDIDVASDARATLPNEATAIVVDQLDLIGRFTARPTGRERTIIVHTTGPERAFTITLTADSATFATADRATTADVTIPAEAFCRLVYGRLDGDHTPDTVTGDLTALDELREVFPGP